MFRGAQDVLTVRRVSSAEKLHSHMKYPRKTQPGLSFYHIAQVGSMKSEFTLASI